jgi:hypothetical protein
MSDFYWRIEDDPTTYRQPDARPPGPIRPRRAWLLAFGVLALVVALAAGTVTWRARHVADEQRAAVLRVVQLEDRLLRSGDRDALRTVQEPDFSPDGQPWLVFGPPDAGIPTVFGDVQVEGDRAQIDVTRVYRASGATHTLIFQLRETQHYRFDDTRGWLRAPAPAPGQDDVAHLATGTLEIVYPARDATTVAALAPRLDALAGQVCVELNCGHAHPSLLLAPLPANTRTSSPSASAPAPLVAGTPLDANGVEALYRQTYAPALVRALVLFNAAREVTPEGSWLAWEFARLGLREPLAADTLRGAATRALRSGTSPLRAPDDLRAATWLALDFLARDGRNPLPGLLATSTPMLTQLAQRTDADAAAWWDYLARIAALEPAEAGDAQLALACDGQAMLWDAHTGAVRALGMQAAGGLVWSPDGQRLAVTHSLTRFSVFDLASGTHWDGENQLRAWAPGSAALVAQIGGSRFSAIRYLWPLDDTPAGRMTPLALGTGWAGWSPDGRRLAYVEMQSEPRLYIADPDGSNAHVIGTGGRAAWSPDSRYLAFADDSVLDPAVYRYDVENGAVTTVIAHAQGALYGLAWSPDGEWLAAASYEPQPAIEHGHVQIVGLDGRVAQEQTLHTRPFDPQWAPDGRALGWLTLPNGAEPGALYLWDLERGSVEHRTEFAWPDRTAPRWGWSPDGRWLALDNGRVTLWATATGAAREFPACTALAWRP